jgi:uncharacterized protein with ParB-like and HNH nuclease domain
LQTGPSVTNQPVDRLLDWVEYLEQKARVIWVQVPDDANAFRIFETLNDRGLDLSIADLLKNYLFGMAGDRIDEAQQHWASMVGTLETVGSENIITTYVRHLWSSKYGLTRERELYTSIKKIVTSRKAAVDFSEELANDAVLYAALLYSEHELWMDLGTTAKTDVQPCDS